MRSKNAAVGVAAAIVTGWWLASAGLAAAEPTEPPAPPEPPKTSIEEDGSYAVGTDIMPGSYASAGPVEDGTCYWKRVASVEGQDAGGVDEGEGDEGEAEEGEIIDNAMTKKPQVVHIDATDGTFVTNGCQPWQQSTAPAEAELPPDIAGLIGKAKLRQYIDTLNRNAQQFGQVPPP